MTEHYYSHIQNVESDPKYWDCTLKNHRFRFKTDNGVFSKKEVDFGSRLLIESFELPKTEGPILDVGCGYGPIGLTIAHSDQDRLMHMIEVNERALALARENAALNQISNVKIYESDRLLNVEEKSFAAILTNPPIRAGKAVVHAIFEESFAHLIPNGEFWIVIQKKQGAPSAIEKLKSIYSKVEIVKRDKGYFIIKSVK